MCIFTFTNVANDPFSCVRIDFMHNYTNTFKHVKFKRFLYLYIFFAISFSVHSLKEFVH